MTGILIGDTQRKDTHMDRRGGGCVKTEAEAGVTWPQAKKHLELPEVGGRRQEAESPQSR